ncbi:PP2C family protein-serine/threonine phosphatase [Humisphaera borealis]|uniref:SpoIIE family protein phosphatase n=1 Tax=Humisphaera borealis TaxID=2807512 RepID=A0A7M2WRG5_9BACT|nr:PP2C family protein-serine/threonine phosphatase [Humisphaera borealis]QOV88145.1 SpoIIE family protein phosphatase [Humisphaera borealis]
MEFAVKKFARNVLLLHLLLLLVVLALMLFASRAIREGAREQAQKQAESRQRIIAAQTARGIEAFYHSIVSDMDLMPRPEDDQQDRDRLGKMFSEMTRDIPIPVFGHPKTEPSSPGTQPAPRNPLFPKPATRPGQKDFRDPEDKKNPPPPSSTQRQQYVRGLLLGQVLSRQLEERVSHMFVIGRPIPKTGPVPIREVSVTPAEGVGPTPEQLAERYRDWLRDVHAQSISKFELFDGKGYNLVAIPVTRGSGVMVAAVPVATITELYLSTLNNDPATGVLLVNDSLTVMASSRPNLVGVNISASGDPDLALNLEASKEAGFKESRVIEHPFKLGEEKFDPALLTTEPIEIAGRKWFIVVGSPLKEVDGVVAALFSKIFIWAIFVVAAVTVILVSTSVQMIRNRLRLERVQTEAIHKELDRARQIQQAWLPRESPRSPNIDVAAVNFPANHISGDFYNWFELPDGRVAVVIGDVTGHGMSAAFLMATTQLLVRTTMQRISDPAACLDEINRQLCTLIFNGQFVTLQIAVIDPDGGPIEVSSAGHPAPLLAGDRTFEPLPVESQLVLGVDPDATYQTVTLDLPVGASLLMFTDGAPDVQAPNGKRFGAQGLHGTCPLRPGRTSDLSTHDARWLLDAVVAKVNHFRGSRELGDDLTLVAIRTKAPALTPTGSLVGVA